MATFSLDLDTIHSSPLAPLYGHTHARTCTQCDAGSSALSILVRTNSNRHTAFGTMTSLNIEQGDPATSIGIFPAFQSVTGFDTITIVREDDGAEAQYTLVSTITSSLEETILGCGVTSAYTTEPSTTAWTAAYSGLKTDGDITFTSQTSTGTSPGTNPSHMFICGVNLESDDDHSVLAFTDNTGAQGNGWSDSWRGDHQWGTMWSLFNDDYKNDRGWTSLQGYPGYKGNSDNQGTYAVYAVLSGEHSFLPFCVLQNVL